MFNPKLLENFVGKKILVIGDFMLDEYIEGKVERISPEAPVPVVEAKGIEIRPGGAANVVANLVSLGAFAVPLGVIGGDEDGRKLKEELKKVGVPTETLIEDPSRPTTKKTRIIASSQQLLRVDWECREEITKEVENKILSFLLNNYEDFDGIVISDYGKGVVTRNLFKVTGKVKEKTPIFLDPKEKNFKVYKNVTAMTPNIKETFQAVGIRPKTNEEAETAGKKLIEEFQLDFAVITRSEKGMSVITKSRVKHIPTRAKQVYDVTGAGDTVISTFALAFVSGADPFTAAEVANLAAGIVVGKVGTATVTLKELKEALKSAL
ncbi:MAG: D-glycero-beta-D-manno-heptose-7-phosphate kinase [Desulfurobacteriaceae bacterium]